jgi:hypothetical protein
MRSTPSFCPSGRGKWSRVCLAARDYMRFAEQLWTRVPVGAANIAAFTEDAGFSRCGSQTIDIGAGLLLTIFTSGFRNACSAYRRRHWRGRRDWRRRHSSNAAKSAAKTAAARQRRTTRSQPTSSTINSGNLSPAIARGNEAGGYVQQLLGMGGDPAAAAKAFDTIQNSTGYQFQLNQGSGRSTPTPMRAAWATAERP